MDVLSVSPAWMLGPGAIGGLLNALFTDNLHLRPRKVRLGAARSVASVGFIANVAAGALAAFALIAALSEGGCSPADRSMWSMSMVTLAGMGIGLAAARALTNECDKRLLRAAACKASAAPAAHPDAVRAIETGSPYEAYTIAEMLMPRRVSFSNDDC